MYLFQIDPSFKYFEYYKSRRMYNFKVSIANKICCFIQFYRSPSQKQEEFQAFKSNLEMNLEALSTNNPLLTVMIGDFKMKQLVFK